MLSRLFFDIANEELSLDHDIFSIYRRVRVVEASLSADYTWFRSAARLISRSKSGRTTSNRETSLRRSRTRFVPWVTYIGSIVISDDCMPLSSRLLFAICTTHHPLHPWLKIIRAARYWTATSMMSRSKGCCRKQYFDRSWISESQRVILHEKDFKSNSRGKSKRFDSFREQTGTLWPVRNKLLLSPCTSYYSLIRLIIWSKLEMRESF